MRTTSQTNSDFSNHDPRAQYEKASEACSKDELQTRYDDQNISKNCQLILSIAEKTATDYSEFITLRQERFLAILNREFELSPDENNDDLIEEEVES